MPNYRLILCVLLFFILSPFTSPSAGLPSAAALQLMLPPVAAYDCPPQLSGLLPPLAHSKPTSTLPLVPSRPHTSCSPTSSTRSLPPSSHLPSPLVRPTTQPRNPPYPLPWRTEVNARNTELPAVGKSQKGNVQACRLRRQHRGKESMKQNTSSAHPLHQRLVRAMLGT